MNKNIEAKPVVIKDEKAAQKLLKQKPYVTFVDAFSDQLKELFFIENHKFIGQPKKEVYKTKEFELFCEKKKNAFTHVYFSWNHTLVKTVKKETYLSLKTNRNQDLITPTEQKKLSDFKVGVFGMSVGSNIAFVLTQAGISNDITIADFDELSTTNLNRILAGVHQVGVNKTIVAARKIYEDNPFAKVRCMEKGLTSALLEKLLKNKALNCIVEEVDSLPVKIETRLLAMKYKIPVLMITDNGDGVVLHVERYDLGLKTIFDKPASYWEDFLKSPIDKQKVGKMIIEDIFGGADKAAPRVMESVQKVFSGQLVSWPQLGSAALLGGVVVTVYIKKIIQGEKMPLSISRHIHI